MSKLPIAWDLAKLYNGVDDPRMEADLKAWEEATKAFAQKWESRSDYLSDPVVLTEALAEYEAWARNFGTDANPLYYFYLRSRLDQTDTAIKAKVTQYELLSKNLMNEVLFFELRLGKVTAEHQAIFLAHSDLQPYKHFLENLFEQAKYTLSEGEEKVSLLLGGPAYREWTQMIRQLLSAEEGEVLMPDGTKQQKTLSEITDLLSSTHKATRDSAAVELNRILAKHADVAEHELNSVLQYKQIQDQLRKYPHPATARHVSDDISSEVVAALQKAVNDAATISQHFYILKAKLMGVEQLAYHERNVPIKFDGQEQEYSYAEAVEMVRTTLTNLDSDFVQIFDQFVQDGHIDVLPAKGKHNGAFCVYGLPSQPIYILINYNNKLSDVSTLAHEVGHGINDELMRRSQNALNFSTPLSTAEVASTFMEDFVLDQLWADATPEKRLELMMEKLGDDVSTIFRQIACYSFEEELHAEARKQGYLSKVQIGELFQKYMAGYMGPAVEQSTGSQNWWIYWGHIRSFFYNYSYASGLLISKALQRKVREQPEFIAKVKEYLSTGRADSPENIFKNLGVDISDAAFWKGGLNEVAELLHEAEKLAKELGKI